jgi:hypothetical protein
MRRPTQQQLQQTTARQPQIAQQQRGATQPQQPATAPLLVVMQHQVPVVQQWVKIMQQQGTKNATAGMCSVKQAPIMKQKVPVMHHLLLKIKSLWTLL